MQRTHLTVFDLDKTLVTGNCSFAFCRYLVSRKVLPVSSLFCALLYYVRHTFWGMSLRELHTRVFTHLLKGKSLKTLEEHVEPFLRHYLPSKRYMPVLRRLKEAQQLGHYTLILSSSPSFLVKKVAQYFQVDASFSTEYEVDHDRNLCHIAFMMQGEEKASVVQKMAQTLSLPMKNVTAYSDSCCDLPLLLSVGEAVAVNPDDKLRRICRENHWKIL